MPIGPDHEGTPAADRGAQRLSAGDLLIDLGRMAVSRDGQELPLSRLSFDLLVVLARAAPNVVTHAELMERVWPGLVVGPETITQRVKLLRTSLGDEAHEPRYIAGLRGRGYRLIPPVIEIADRTPRADAESAPPRAGRRLLAYTLAMAFALSAALYLSGPPGGEAGQGRPPALADPAGAAVSAPPTVAVLPFDTLSADPGDSYLGSGMAEIVLNRLAASDAAQVVSRASSFSAARDDVDAQQLAARLGVRFVVRGRVQRSGDALRVTVEVADSSTPGQSQALQVDGRLSGLFELQDNVAASVGAALDLRLAAAPRATQQLPAWLEYLQGLDAAGSWRVPALESAIAHFERARGLDPGFAAAYAAEALARRNLHFLTVGDESYRNDTRLRWLLTRALELDPQLAAGYVQRAELAATPQQAEADLRHALRLAPGDASAHLALARELRRMGRRPAEVLASYDRAVTLDPLQAHPRYQRALTRFDLDRDLNRLEAELLQILDIDPQYTQALTRLAGIEAGLRGRYAAAIALAERGLAADPASFYARERAAELYLAAGDAAAAAELTAHIPANSLPGVALAFFLDRPPQISLLSAPPGQDPRGPAHPAFMGTLLEQGYALALRDEALRLREPSRALRLLRSASCWSGDSARPCAPDNAPTLALTMAELEIAAGNRDAGERLARRVLRHLEHTRPKPLAADYHLLNRARAQLLLGRSDRALQLLEDAWRARGFLRCWMLLERDAAFAALRTDPRFAALLAAARGHAAGERGALEELRRSGRIPSRPT